MVSTPKLETMPVARTPLDPADLLTPEELAARLKVPKSWIFEQTRQRSKIRNKSPLLCIRLGKYLRFSWVQVSAWLVENKD
jgi:hypothetical protein